MLLMRMCRNKRDGCRLSLNNYSRDEDTSVMRQSRIVNVALWHCVPRLAPKRYRLTSRSGCAVEKSAVRYGQRGRLRVGRHVTAISAGNIGCECIRICPHEGGAPQSQRPPTNVATFLENIELDIFEIVSIPAYIAPPEYALLP